SVVDSAAPPRRNVIRGELSARYELQEIDGGRRTLLTIEVHCDPKGLLPVSFVNLSQKRWPRLTVAGIRRQVQKPLSIPETFATYLGELSFSPVERLTSLEVQPVSANP